MDPHSVFRIRSDGDFRRAALETFRDQYQNIPAYREFCDLLGRNPENIPGTDAIPCLPIEFFKTRRILHPGSTEAAVFQSSGTTRSGLSRHYVADLALYQASYTLGFEHFYGPVTDWCILALLPSYEENPHSSLIHMVQGLIRRSGHPGSGFIGGSPKSQAIRIQEADAGPGKVLLIGVSFALLDLAQAVPLNLSNTVVMETGGMKGRRQELVREALHGQLCTGFGVDRIHSEYGMTELLSQGYSAGFGEFRSPPWMRVRIRDTEDPLALLGTGRTGGIDIIDLANRDSCAFIATQDLGRLKPDGTFEVLGRFDHSDIRGCNLMAL